MAAGEQGRFWEFHDKIFANQRALSREQYVKYATELGLDVKRFQAALDEARGKKIVDGDVADAKQLGATGTPAFFINGRFLSGAKPFAEFAQKINAELARLKIPIPDGAKTAGG